MIARAMKFDLCKAVSIAEYKVLSNLKDSDRQTKSVNFLSNSRAKAMKFGMSETDRFLKLSI